MLFVFSSQSGAANISIYKEIMSDNPGIDFSVQATTRKKREDETDGKNYFFLEKAEFEKRIENGEFAEYEKISGNFYYGTLKSFIEDKIKNGKDVIFDLNVKGALTIKKIYKENAILILIKSPIKEVLNERFLKGNTENPEKSGNELSRFDFEVEKINEFNYVIVNDDLKKTINEVQKIINKYKQGAN
jgi:guanylate kinase